MGTGIGKKKQKKIDIHSTFEIFGVWVIVTLNSSRLKTFANVHVFGHINKQRGFFLDIAGDKRIKRRFK